MTRVTQKIIAQSLGLSPSLVSRALSGKAESIGSRAETTRQIVQTASRMGYVPNAAARQLRGQGGPVVGVVVADMGDPFFNQVMTEVIRQAHRQSCAIAVAGFDRRQVNQRDLAILLEQNLTGLLMIGGGPSDDISAMQRPAMKCVRVGPITTSPILHQIGPDEVDGFSKLIRHLGLLGHRRIGLIGADLAVHRERLKRARRLAQQAGMTCHSRHVYIGSDHVLQAGLEGGRALMELAGASAPTAIMCSSDTVAMGVMSALTRSGVRIPEDFSVTGFDDVILSQLCSPSLTTLRQPIAEMIRMALDFILAGKPFENPACLPLDIVIRDSTGKAA